MIELHRFWREPLVHFLFIGAGLFLLFGMTQEQSSDAPNRIVVSPSQIEQLAAQFKRTWLRPPREEELARLIEGYVRNEVYYREALAMGLDRNDPQVRQRMRLKLEFLLEDLTAEGAPSDEVLTKFMQQHPDDFRLEHRVSFLQLYLNPDKHRDFAADTKRLMASLEDGAAPESVGDPTLLQLEYVLASQSAIARDFGEELALEVVTLAPGEWVGPLFSRLGGHLIKVTERVEGRMPALAEVRSQVEREYLARRRQELKDMAYQKLSEGYEVVIEQPASADDRGLPAAEERVAR
ncbi:MAG: peptidylprolyl isomerase [Thiogranum sp.]